LFADGVAGEAVGLSVALARDVRNGEVKRASQLATDPVQGIQAWAAATVLAPHLLDHDFRVRVDVKCLGSQGQGTLQGFKESNIFGHIVVLSSNRFRNSDLAVLGTVHHHPNTRRARTPQRAAVYIGYEI
jgi:hypothetical protein